MNTARVFTWPPTVFLVVVLCALMWGSAFPCVKIGFALLKIDTSTGGKLYFAGLRFLIAGIAMLAGVRLTGRSLRLPATNDYLYMLVIGLVQTTLQYICFYIGLSNTTGVKASIIVGSGSFFLALFSHWWIPEDSLTRRNVVGLIIGFGGILLVNLHKESLNLDFKLTGEGLILATTILSAVALLVVKKTAARIYPPLICGYQLTLGSVFLLLLAAGLESPQVLQFSSSAVLLLLYLSFVSAMAFTLWYLLIQHHHLTEMAIYRFLIPVSGAILSALILPMEGFTWNVLGALGLVSAGMVLTTRP